ncbi:hypothetical protein GCM10009122_39110 [Fulvivirga kasyanovii]|uniref:Amino acid adenylation domain-containing protein n=1 Tax=Fulvivirga kasyanovii TaxID=396812 RepID=A0ABW9RJ37_9BACT|nr:non-ribosomal peptide synthetase [Fulvivirga kasyanovii]MTI23892.1 amino acid adenylation domain-containing protein [Fulvivirga kasyanovii]
MSLDKNNVLDIIPLTPLQQGILFQHIRAESKTNYFEQLSFDFRFSLGVDQIREAFDNLAEQNPNLRCLFRWKNISNPVAIYLKTSNVDFTFYDLTNKDVGSRKEFCNQIARKEFEKGFDLEEIPFRVSLCQIEDSTYNIIISNHHILYDGWSNIVILKHLFSLLMYGKPPSFTTSSRIPFKDYVTEISGRNYEPSKKFWRDHLGKLNQHTRLPYKQADLLGHDSFAKESIFENRKKVEKFCTENRITIAHLFYGVWGFLLQVYNNSDNSVFGTTLSGRSIDLSKFENVVGLFINTLPLYFETKPNETIIDYLHRLSQHIHARSEHELFPLSEVQKFANIDSQEELFDSIVVVENYPLKSFLTEYNEIINVDSVASISTNHYDLTIEVSFLNEIRVDFVYNRNVFTNGSVEVISNHFEQVLNYFIDNFDKPVSTIDIVKQGHTFDVYSKVNATSVPIAEDITIIDLFKNIVDRYPDRVAVKSHKNLTYREFFNISSEVANKLLSIGVGPNTIVGLYIERSVDFLIGVYGILLSGGAYLPLDPKHPQKRVEYILKDSNCETILTNKTAASRLQVDSVSVILLEECENCPPLKRTIVRSNDLAYVIYTSGTTGVPKGVMIDHLALLNRLQWMQRKYELKQDNVILNKTTPVFDVSVWELLWWSTVGASVSVLADGNEGDPIEIIKNVDYQKVTTIHFVPSMLAAFLQIVDAASVQRLKSLEIVFCSGEALNREHVEKFNELFGHASTRLVNLYGPTEATIDVSYYDCSKTEVKPNIPIGKPIDNIQLFVINKFENKQPLGLPGELVISGAGLARGYLNKVELTHQKFKKKEQVGINRYYKTGDLARLTTDGNFDYLGRLDNQVKIRGFRIELHEIENVIKRYEGIDQAVVLYQKVENQNDLLCAYYVAKGEIDLSELQILLRQYLPNYMVPSIYQRLPTMPLNFNGKIDRSALKITGNTVQRNSVVVEKNLNELETKIVEICAKVLDRDNVDIDQSFFRNGGDSIKAIQVQSRFLKEGYKLNITDIMSANHLREISVAIKVHDDEVEEYKLIGEVGCTPSEELFFKSNWSNLDNFNQGVTLRSKQRFNKNAVIEAIHILTEHHDGLRANFFKSELGYRKIIGDEQFPNSFFEFEEIDSDNPELVAEKIIELRRSIKLENKQLLKFGVFSLKNEDHLVIIAHHLLVDGVSWRIVIEDFIDFYNDIIKGVDPKKARKTTSIREWCESLRSFSKTPRFLKSVEYWKQLSRDRVAYKDENINKWKTYKRKTLSLNERLTKDLLYNTHNAYGTTVTDILLYANGLAFMKSFKPRNVAITLEGHGRENIYNNVNLSRTVGWFTSIYPVLLKLGNKGDIEEDLVSVIETVRNVPFNGLGYGVLKCFTNTADIDIPTDFLLNYLGDIEHDLINNQDYDCQFHSDQDTLDGENQMEHKLLITGIVSHKNLKINFDYDPEKYDENSIQCFIRKVEVEISKVVEHCTSISETIKTPKDFSDPDMTTDELKLINQMFEDG